MRLAPPPAAVLVSCGALATGCYLSHPPPGDAGVAPPDAGADDGPEPCDGDDPSRWPTVDLDFGGDWDRIEVTVWGREAWIAAAPTALAPGELHRLRVGWNAQGLPEVLEDAVLPDTFDLVPSAIAFSLCCPDFLNATTAIVTRSRAGEVELLLVGLDGTVWGRTPLDFLDGPGESWLDASIVASGERLIVAAEQRGTDSLAVAVYDLGLGLMTELTLPSSPFRLRADDGGAARLRARETEWKIDDDSARVSGDGLEAWTQVGATPTAWVGLADRGFVIVEDDGTSTVSAWPAPSIATNGYLPAADSPLGRLVSVNSDLSLLLGRAGADGALAWETVPRVGGAMAPFGGERGFGVLFLGIDLPHPEQPLRFWGRACP